MITTRSEWNDTAQKQISKEELRELLESHNENGLGPADSVVTAHDHTDKLWELVDDREAIFNRKIWRFELQVESHNPENGMV